MPRGSLRGWKKDSINKPGIHRKRGGLLGGVPTLQETGLTGPLSIYKVVPKVAFQWYALANQRPHRISKTIGFGRTDGAPPATQPYPSQFFECRSPTHFLQHITTRIQMVQIKVTASVLIAATAIAPAVAYGFEAEESLVTHGIYTCVLFRFTNKYSNVAAMTTNSPAHTAEVLISTCKPLAGTPT
jgi:hypothetical protein